ncbi:MAG: glucosaminidase domain-containing protein [Bacteroidales bacterium]|nr:glucosaminidase domain-containing protein [Bacteroidota bacterium]MBL6950763.1 glucosaminidase domain-containing protein [Bacteroidales bacterium]
MKRSVQLGMVMLALSFMTSVSYAQKRAISSQDKSFLIEFIPKIISANQEVQTDRNRILTCKDEYQRTGKLTDEDEVFLSKTSSKYDINSFKLDDENDQPAFLKELSDLLLRVDIIPTKLVMAQAICESAWGRSYFAEHGNNFFGIHCYSKGCGLVPSGNPNGGFEVKSYPTIEAGIADYIHTLNTVSAYARIRSMRAQMRQEKQPVSATQLAEGLSRYSQKGEEYVSLIQNLIHNYVPENIESFIETNKE